MTKVQNRSSQYKLHEHYAVRMFFLFFRQSFWPCNSILGWAEELYWSGTWSFGQPSTH